MSWLSKTTVQHTHSSRQIKPEKDKIKRQQTDQKIFRTILKEEVLVPEGALGLDLQHWCARQLRAVVSVSGIRISSMKENRHIPNNSSVIDSLVQSQCAVHWCTLGGEVLGFNNRACEADGISSNKHDVPYDVVPGHAGRQRRVDADAGNGAEHHQRLQAH